MSYSLAYWICIFIWLLLGLWSNWPVTGNGARVIGGTLLQFVLFVLIGLAIFGKPLHQ